MERKAKAKGKLDKGTGHVPPPSKMARIPPTQVARDRDSDEVVVRQLVTPRRPLQIHFSQVNDKSVINQTD